jgi:hypothetical protein
MEKVENLYRTAHVNNDSIDTQEHFGSRLRDARWRISGPLRPHAKVAHQLGAIAAGISEQFMPIRPPWPRLPHVRNFDAELFESCADRARRAPSFVKV